LIQRAIQIPAKLQAYSQWVAWKYLERDGKRTKTPINPHTGELADSTDPATWSTFDKAIGACERDICLQGVGFVFTESDGLCGIDIDDCRDADTGELKPWATQIIKRFNSYTEVSPSGTGVKIFTEATKPGRRCRSKYHDGEIEIYDNSRFFTVTNHRVADTPTEIVASQDALEMLYSEVFGLETATTSPLVVFPEAEDRNAPLTDSEIIEIASKQRRSGDKFRALWAGNWNSYFNSASEADSSIVFTLAFYTKDSSQIDRLFRASGLMRPKWDQFHGEQTYGEITISKALGSVKKQYKPKRRRRSPQTAAVIDPISDSSKPAIIISNIQLEEATDQTLNAITQANQPPEVFVRASSLARVVHDEFGRPHIQEMDRLRVRCRMSEVADFFNIRKGEGGIPEAVASYPPLSIADNVIARKHWDLPTLNGITRSPIVHSDGTIRTQAGYDPETGLLYSPDPDLDLVPIPEGPCGEETRACVDILLDVISDFPFADQSSRANALAILFTLLMRPVIKGHIPLAVVDAPMQGTGKTLLVSSLASIAVGSVACHSIPSQNNDDEWRKKITAILRTGDPFVLLDNIPDNTEITSPSLAAAITSHEWIDRLLGSSSDIRLPSRSVWVATGNNLKVSGDIPRRSYSVRLDANAERPWQRTGFRIKNLEEHVHRDRGNLLSAALTIIRAWYTNGQPKVEVPPLGSFNEWAETIGSILAFAEVDGFLGNLDQTRDVQDEDSQQWVDFFDAWWQVFGDQPVVVDEVCKQLIETDVHDGCARAVPDAVLENVDVHRAHSGALRKSVGRNLSRLSGRIFNGHKLLRSGVDSHRKVRRWKLAGLETPQNQANPASNPAT
jgi:hypothetical protein